MNKRKVISILFCLIIFGIGFISCTEKTELTETGNDFISFTQTDLAFQLAKDDEVAPIIIHNDEYPGVEWAANLFKNDLEMVTGLEAEVFKNDIPAQTTPVIIGTLGKSPLIDQLVANKKIDVTDMEGKWEVSLIQVVDNPYEGVEKALVIAGSDKRSTIYGLFELSKQMGVSPWYWWADVPVKNHSDIFIKSGRYNFGEPKVKYRGIFLNDEEPALGRWAVENYGGFTHEFYENVFELILRLKGNYLWPAMWWASFNSDDPQNPVLADKLGIVMGTTHHEPMVRAHAEWDPWGGGEWNYETNAAQLQQFWREGIERMDDRETIVTIGMRGDGDVGMSEEANIGLLQKIVEDQRKIIANVTGKQAKETPQLWALYKEVQEYYDKGMRVPDDVTLLLCDDNWGNVRKLPAPDAEAREGGYGLYYHFDFVGGPRNYKWLNVTPIPKIWEQLHLTYKHGVDRIWLVNVGDLKPMELPISFFLDYAWNPEDWPVDKLVEYTTIWAKQQFGDEYAQEIAEILDLYTKYNRRRTPELLYSDTYSLENYREFETIVTDYNRIKEQARNLYEDMGEDHKDAFYQLVYHPVLACANLNEMYYAHALNQLYAKQERAATNAMAEKVENLFEKDAEITNYYHKELSGGKWNNMMAQTHIGYTNWQEPPVNAMPPVLTINVPRRGELKFCVEGNLSVFPDQIAEAELPAFDSYNRQAFYIELFNTGNTSIDFRLKPSENWIALSKNEGVLEEQERIKTQINWEQLETGISEGTVEVISDGETISTIKIGAQKFGDNPGIRGFIERNGVVSIEAPHYTLKEESDHIEWMEIPGHGRTGSGMTTSPVTISMEELSEDAPQLEYEFFLLNDPANEEVEVEVHLAPTLNFKNGSGLKFALSVDDNEPQVINMHEGNEVPDWKYPLWFNRAVSNSVMVEKSKHKVSTKGLHTLKIRMIDNGIVFQKIIIDNGGLKASYLGPPESLKL